jgi:hypothetical protein
LFCLTYTWAEQFSKKKKKKNLTKQFNIHKTKKAMIPRLSPLSAEAKKESISEIMSKNQMRENVENKKTFSRRLRPPYRWYRN